MKQQLQPQGRIFFSVVASAACQEDEYEETGEEWRGPLLFPMGLADWLGRLTELSRSFARLRRMAKAPVRSNQFSVGATRRPLEDKHFPENQSAPQFSHQG